MGGGESLATARRAGEVALVEGLANQGFDNGLAADVEFLAAFSSSSSMAAVKSTLTRWMGFIILPEFEKKREMSLPRSAMRAMVSAVRGFCRGCVFFIEFPSAGVAFQRVTR